ncbi:DUF6279 family lipoprotein [Vibrio hangzhouensis]|uniref:Lipoprotein n=1 Tax=Vibrio hangzhouensis TaxID=462991 RepID=A0A1H5RUC1_9VIBR|nr:DUF6279 family lipoprotein [Vibrio hangzhouensis]SEF41724.1 hypothetical protein SAMN04488244_101117 [Vibrio hangzhouensis]
MRLLFSKLRLSVLVSLIIISGCTTKFLYSNLDWVLVEYIDDYVTLSDGQEDILSERITLLGQWHKENELPQYLEQLTQIRNQDPKKIDAGYVLKQMDDVKIHTKRLMNQVTPDLYALTLQMSDEQVKELLQNFEKQDRRFVEKYQGLSEVEIREIYRERIEKNMVRWYGDLTDEQKALAKAWSDDMEVTIFDWQAHRQQMQYYMRQLLNRRNDLAYYQPEFQRFLNNSESFYSVQLARKIDYNRDVAAKYIAQSLNLMTTQQHQHLVMEIDEWRDIASDLISQLLLDYSPTDIFVLSTYTKSVSS